MQALAARGAGSAVAAACAAFAGVRPLREPQVADVHLGRVLGDAEASGGAGGTAE